MVTGVNLPMVVRLGCAEPEQRSLTELAHWIEVKGRRAIRRADPPAAESHPNRESGDSES